MFKKEVAIQSKNLLSGSDRKKLREALKRNYVDITPETLDAIIPLKQEFSVAKIKGSTTLVYFLKEQPVLFDIEGRSVLFPTGNWNCKDMFMNLVHFSLYSMEHQKFDENVSNTTCCLQVY